MHEGHWSHRTKGARELLRESASNLCSRRKTESGGEDQGYLSLPYALVFYAPALYVHVKVILGLRSGVHLMLFLRD